METPVTGATAVITAVLTSDVTAVITAAISAVLLLISEEECLS